MTIKVPKDYMCKVYFAEKGARGWGVERGYLLAEYENHIERRYIVTLGDITSCVVRHVTEYALNKREAWASIADKTDDD